MPINNDDQVQPATYEVVPDVAGRGNVVRMSVSFDMDGACLSQALYEEFAHYVDNGQELPESLNIQEILLIIARKHASCAEGWHIWSNEPSQQSHDAAVQFADKTIRWLFDDVAWSID